MLSKPSPNSIKQSKFRKDVAQTAEVSWGEPFVLYYDDVCDEDPNAESQLKFNIQMAYDEIVTGRRREASLA